MEIVCGHSMHIIWSQSGHSHSMYLSCSLSITGHSGHSGHSKSSGVTKRQKEPDPRKLNLCAAIFVRGSSAVTTMTTMTSTDAKGLKKSFAMTVTMTNGKATL